MREVVGMKDRIKICLKCGTKMSYRGSRRFYCPTCKTINEYDLPYKVEAKPVYNPIPGRGTGRRRR
jgi:tRNA(Ile2) C34 agmatinyltransferase TiaS